MLIARTIVDIAHQHTVHVTLAWFRFHRRWFNHACKNQDVPLATYSCGFRQSRAKKNRSTGKLYIYIYLHPTLALVKLQTNPH